MNYIYLDTSPLMRLAESDISTPYPRNAAIAQIVNGFISDPDTILAASSHTILEYYNNLAKNWRNTSYQRYR